jgi:hypothetical protein
MRVAVLPHRDQRTILRLDLVIVARFGRPKSSFFGCWLDINQPFKPGTTTASNVLPVKAIAPLEVPTLTQAIRLNDRPRNRAQPASIRDHSAWGASV